MRKIVLAMSISVDGFFAGPNGELDWHLVSDELHCHFNEHLRAMSAFLDGRVMHEMMAEFWPTADADPASTPTTSSTMPVAPTRVRNHVFRLGRAPSRANRVSPLWGRT